MPIVYLRGDATTPLGEGPRVVAHVCNDSGGFGKGFALAVSQRWPQAREYYRRWYHSKDGFALGTIQVVEVGPKLWVANMIAQWGYKTGSKGPPIRYEALRRCLERLAVEAEEKGASVHMPRIGCGLAGGSWDLVCPIIEETLQDHEVYVYDYSG